MQLPACTSASDLQKAHALSMQARSWGRDMAGAQRGPDETRGVVDQNQTQRWGHPRIQLQEEVAKVSTLLISFNF